MSVDEHALVTRREAFALGALGGLGACGFIAALLAAGAYIGQHILDRFDAGDFSGAVQR